MSLSRLYLRVRVGQPEGEIRLAVMAGEAIICWDEMGVPAFD